MENAKSRRLRRLRTRLDSIGREPDPVCEQEVPEHSLGQGWVGWAHERGEE